MQVQFIMYDILGGCRVETEISHIEHKVVKIRDQEGASKVLKILTFASQNESLLLKTKLEIQMRKEFLRRRYQKSQIQVDRMMMVQEKTETKKNKQVKILKVLTPYVEHNTLSFYYNKVSTNRVKGITYTVQNVIYMFEEFFQVILRGGGMQNFFYTPQNLFFVHADRDFKVEWPTLQVNYGSFVGLKLLNDENCLKKDEFLQIYPLLSPEIFKLLKEQESRQIERLIKMRALGWLIFTFITKKVPDLLFDKKLNVLMSKQEMEQLLSISKQRFKQALKVMKSKTEQFGKKLGIKLYDLLHKIFVEDCTNLTWRDIHHMLFTSNVLSKSVRLHESRLLEQELGQTQNQNQLQLKRKRHQTVNSALIKLFWLFQNQKDYYISRSIQPNSFLFMLVKLNIDFHAVLRKVNFAHILQKFQFSEISEKIFSSMIKFNAQVQRLLKEKQNQKLLLNIQGAYQQILDGLHLRVVPMNQAQQNIQPSQLVGDCFKLMSEQLLWGDCMMRRPKNNETQTEIISIHKNYEELKMFENSLWLQ